ncbi:MAG TPA: nucleoside monophosphate kinase [Candidatus Limnocylindrales bacterium]|nr:nucleoside monophosphate kinase [Candidatus Limnocylindrales bacterium]
MIILMGVAGAGKSMQGRMLADEHGYAWISTGEILRVLVTGKRRQEMLQGKLLSDDEVIELIDKVFELIDTKQQFVLDGFPRTVPQTEWLLEQVDKGRFNLDAIINMSASQDVVFERLVRRGRPDDTKEAITERFKEYEEVTRPILKCFHDNKVPVVDINADRDARIIHDEILEYIDKED